MCMKADQLAASIQLGTRLVFGAGPWARVSRCLGGAPLVKLFQTRAECDELAALNKKCCPDCIGLHETIEVMPFRDECTVELGEREKVAR